MLIRTTADLGRAARDRRRELGETKELIADLSGVHRVTIGKFESGRGVNFEATLRIVHMLEMDLEVRTRGGRRDGD
jgi:transcriptional regulator with XRE-family HTH domain